MALVRHYIECIEHVQEDPIYLITTIEAFIKVENGHGKSVFTRLSLAEAMLFLSENFIGYKTGTYWCYVLVDLAEDCC